MITKIQRGIFYIHTDGITYRSKGSGKLRKKNIIPIVGDIVDFSISKEDDKGYIESILERKTQLLRPQVANIDQVMIIMSIKNPSINLNLLDKYLIMIEKSGICPIILFNKEDLIDENERDHYSKIYEDIGYKVIFNSNKENYNYQLKDLFLNKITSVAGPSGVGKSSTLNRIFPNLCLETGEISEKSKRGKHTTRHVEIMEIDENTFVLDTPGFSSLSLEFIESKEEIKHLFPEFNKDYGKCKFDNCMHLKEPGCIIKEKLGNGEISPTRYENYQLFVDEYNSSRRY